MFENGINVIKNQPMMNVIILLFLYDFIAINTKDIRMRIERMTLRLNREFEIAILW